MADVQSLRTHLLTELRDLLDAEQQLTKALPTFASRASSPALRTAFERHLQETEGHIRRLTQAFEMLGERAQSKRCEGMQGLIREGNSVVGSTREGALRDAVMITSAQKVEHYEIASYGTARTYATVLGESQVADLLAATLQEEKNADAKLTSIAESKVNESAAAEWHSTGPGLVEQTATLAGRAVSLGARTVQRATTAMGRASGRSGNSAAVVEQLTSTLNRAMDSAAEMASEVAGSARSQVRRATSQSSRKTTGARKTARKRTSRPTKGAQRQKRR